LKGTVPRTKKKARESSVMLQRVEKKRQGKQPSRRRLLQGDAAIQHEETKLRSRKDKSFERGKSNTNEKKRL